MKKDELQALIDQGDLETILTKVNESISLKKQYDGVNEKLKAETKALKELEFGVAAKAAGLSEKQISTMIAISDVEKLTSVDLSVFKVDEVKDETNAGEVETKSAETTEPDKLDKLISLIEGKLVDKDETKEETESITVAQSPIDELLTNVTTPEILEEEDEDEVFNKSFLEGVVEKLGKR